jgi:hypothetical protein
MEGDALRADRFVTIFHHGDGGIISLKKKK